MIDPQLAPLGVPLVRAAREHRRWVGARLEQLGLHVGQELLLLQLSRTAGLRQGALAEALGIEPPTVHRTVSRLEAAGFVERRRDPDDARASLTFLTPRGQEVCAEVERIWQEADRHLAAALTTDEADDLRRLLPRLVPRASPRGVDQRSPTDHNSSRNSTEGEP